MRSRLTNKIGSVFTILSFAAIAELLNNIILGRGMPAMDFGRFKFICTVIITLSTLLQFGQNMAIIRVFSTDSLMRYNWKRFVSVWLNFAAISGALGCLIIGFYYSLFIEMIFAYFAIIATIGIEYQSAILRAKDEPEKAMLLSKNSPVIFFLGLAAIFYFFRKSNFYEIIFIYTLCLAITFTIGNILTKKIPCGIEVLPTKTIKDGLWLFLIAFSYTLMTQVDQFFIVRILGYEKLADYTVIITVTRGFELISTALWFVMMPHYAKDFSRSIKSDTIKVALIGMLACSAYLGFGKPLLHLFFEGRYDHSAYLLIFFIAIGFFKIIYAIPAGIIAGRLSEKYLRLFLWTCVLGIALNLVGNFILIPIMGLGGAAMAALFSWCFRVIAAYYVVYRQSIVVK